MIVVCLPYNSFNALYFKTGEDDIPKLLTSLINNKESLIKPGTSLINNKESLTTQSLAKCPQNFWGWFFLSIVLKLIILFLGVIV